MYTWVSSPVFPACAGMILGVLGACGQTGRVPRMCGDDPEKATTEVMALKCSPHVRG